MFSLGDADEVSRCGDRHSKYDAQCPLVTAIEKTSRRRWGMSFSYQPRSIRASAARTDGGAGALVGSVASHRVAVFVRGVRCARALGEPPVADRTKKKSTQVSRYGARCLPADRHKAPRREDPRSHRNPRKSDASSAASPVARHRSGSGGRQSLTPSLAWYSPCS
jgi:hypothetical protein